MADNLIHRGAYGFWKAAVTQAGWNRLLDIDYVLMADSI